MFTVELSHIMFLFKNDFSIFVTDSEYLELSEVPYNAELLNKATA